MNNTIGVAMIVKNEEEMLARCLESVREADAIYISDTGSTDRTVEIAKQFTPHVFTEYRWQDHFADARNFIKNKLPTDWLLSIDADEELACPFQNVREAVEQAFLAVNCKLVAGDNGQTNLFPRLFKNLPHVRWEGAAHNYPNIYGENVGDVRIRYDYSPAHNLDKDRTLRILEREVAKPVPNEQKARALFYLGREYFVRGRFEDCVITLGRYVQVSGFLAEKAEAFLIMSKAYWYGLKDPDSARDAALQALIINATWKELLDWLAMLSGDGRGNDRWQKNADQFKRMAATAENHDVLFLRT